MKVPLIFACVFPGQGSQSVGMMKGYADFPVVRETFAEASDILGQDFWTMVEEGPLEKLNLTVNTQPLMLTAGVMGWAGISLKPSTVLVFSVALGIAIDVTIRFLVNYKQELPNHDNSVKETVMQTIHSTGISILYTSMVLIAGFVIFVFSGFGGTKALGWLTSLTLLSATVTNLVLLPVLLLTTSKKGKEK